MALKYNAESLTDDPSLIEAVAKSPVIHFTTVFAVSADKTRRPPPRGWQRSPGLRIKRMAKGADDNDRPFEKTLKLLGLWRHCRRLSPTREARLLATVVSGPGSGITSTPYAAFIDRIFFGERSSALSWCLSG